MDIEKEIRRHMLAVEQLNSIKEMEEILAGKSTKYRKYAHNVKFLEGVKYRLEIEKELLQELLSMEL